MDAAIATWIPSMGDPTTILAVCDMLLDDRIPVNHVPLQPLPEENWGALVLPPQTEDQRLVTEHNTTDHLAGGWTWDEMDVDEEDEDEDEVEPVFPVTRRLSGSMLQWAIENGVDVDKINVQREFDLLGDEEKKEVLLMEPETASDFKLALELAADGSDDEEER